MKQPSRRGLLKNAAAAAVSLAGAASLSTEAQAQTGVVWEKKAVHRPPQAPATGTAPASAAPSTPQAPPLFNSIITFGNLVFIAGIGAHFQGTIEEHTKHVLDELE